MRMNKHYGMYTVVDPSGIMRDSGHGELDIDSPKGNIHVEFTFPPDMSGGEVLTLMHRIEAAIITIAKGTRMNEPQPIETAPKIDELLLFEDQWYIGFWGHGRWLIRGQDEAIDPTHWMPLPPNPAPTALAP